jgi:hypothetical protein
VRRIINILVDEEIKRVEKKHGDETEMTLFRAVMVIQKECGEIASCILNDRINESRKTWAAAHNAIQVMAATVRFLNLLERVYNLDLIKFDMPKSN